MNSEWPDWDKWDWSTIGIAAASTAFCCLLICGIGFLIYLGYRHGKKEHIRHDSVNKEHKETLSKKPKCLCGSDRLVDLKCAECQGIVKGCDECLLRLSPCECDAIQSYSDIHVNRKKESLLPAMEIPKRQCGSENLGRMKCAVCHEPTTGCLKCSARIGACRCDEDASSNSNAVVITENIVQCPSVNEKWDRSLCGCGEASLPAHPNEKHDAQEFASKFSVNSVCDEINEENVNEQSNWIQRYNNTIRTNDYKTVSCLCGPGKLESILCVKCCQKYVECHGCHKRLTPCGCNEENEGNWHCTTNVAQKERGICTAVVTEATIPIEADVVTVVPHCVPCNDEQGTSSQFCRERVPRQCKLQNQEDEQEDIRNANSPCGCTEKFEPYYKRRSAARAATVSGCDGEVRAHSDDMMSIWSRIKQRLSRVKRSECQSCDHLAERNALDHVTMEDINNYQIPRRKYGVPDVHEQGCNCSLCHRKNQIVELQKRAFDVAFRRDSDPLSNRRQTERESNERRHEERVHSNVEQHGHWSRSKALKRKVMFSAESAHSALRHSRRIQAQVRSLSQIEERLPKACGCESNDSIKSMAEITKRETIDADMNAIFRDIKRKARAKVRQDILNRKR